jgi:hypothetical protein
MGTFTLTGINYGSDDNAVSNLWVVAGLNGQIVYSSDLSSWTAYQTPVNTTVQNLSVTFGKDSNAQDIWLSTRWWDTAGEVSTSSDPSTGGAGGWTVIDAGSLNSGNDAAYGNNVWVAVGKNTAVRSTDGGSTWSTVTVPSVGNTGSAYGRSSVATDGSGNWIIVSNSSREYQVYKSTDDGASWTLSTAWGWDSSVNWYPKEVSYGNGIWVLSTHDHKIRTCSSAGLATNSWSIAQDLGYTAWDVQYGTSGVWVAAGEGMRSWTSTDNAVTWTPNAVMGGGGAQVMNIAYGDSSWVAVTDGTTNNILKSTDNGSTWSVVNSTGQELRGVTFNSVLPNT